MATRIFAVWKKFGSIPNPGFGDPPTTDWSLPHKHTQAMNSSSRNTVFEGAVEGHVLVKNVGNALPLTKPLVLSLFGYDALPPTVVDPVASNKWKFGYETINASEAGTTSFIDGTWSNVPHLAKWSFGRLCSITGGGSSTSNPPYIVSPYASFAEKACEDLTMLS
jgi:beta-glucosidase